MEGAGQKRKLATIFAADVVGYSKLMARDEEATVRTLRAYRQITDKLIERHDGRIFNTGGDSVLAEFGSVVEAVRCAIAIQDELRMNNAELAPENQMHFRIGINVGDVLIEGDDLLGDGVNVAARLEGLAAPGGICISGSTFEQVKNKLSIGFEDLGPQQVKNIPDPVTAFGITSAPVSLTDGGATPDHPATGGTGKTAITAGLVLAGLVIIAGAWFWMKPQSPSLASLPVNTSTTSMSAEQIVEFVTGLKIEGRRLLDDLPFTIVLGEDKTATYEFPANPGGKERIIGKWRAEDHRFCMQLARFAAGREVCPRIVRQGDKYHAERGDGTVLKWSLSK